MGRDRKEEEVMSSSFAGDAGKQQMLNELKDSLVELSEKRKNGCIRTNYQSWRELFEENLILMPEKVRVEGLG